MHGGGHTHNASGAGRPSPHSSSSGVPAAQLRRFDVLFRRAENRECFDCLAKQPRWASTNLGVFFCLRCAGIHRAMGTHISKVKSTNMDAWEESMIQVMEHIGNARGRVLYEYNMPANARVQPSGNGSADAMALERYIRSKYERKQYYNPNYAALYDSYMTAPVEGGERERPKAAATPPPSAPPTTTSPAVPLEELWGPPVPSPTTSTSPLPHQQQQHRPPPTSGARHTVDELFAVDPSTHPTHTIPSAWLGGGAAGSAPLSPASGFSPGQHTPTSTASGYPYINSGPNASPTSSAGNDWWGSPSGSPSAGVSPPHATAAHADGPFHSGTHQNNNNHNSQGVSNSRDEILSLFGSAPPAGATAPTTRNGMYAAWQPQEVKPYYSPEF